MTIFAFAWTDDVIAKMKDLHHAGKSASEIRREIGAVSRNAVCGKLHRLGVVRPASAECASITKSIEGRRGAIGNRPARANTQAGTFNPSWNRDGKVLPERRPSKAADVLSPNARPWIERGPHQCAFPIITAGVTFSCCNGAVGTYCIPHDRIMHQPGTGKPPSAVKDTARRSKPEPDDEPLPVDQVLSA